MLYHWYELDPDAVAPAEGDGHRALPLPTPAIRYNAEAAKAHARGETFQSDGSYLELRAANDVQADKIAIRLRETGLGLIGEPHQRAAPGDYGLIQQSIRFYQWMKRTAQEFATEVIRSIVQERKRGVSSCSHTMVSNGADDEAKTGNDARRQRFNASIG